jgi:hypothetical protein
MQAGHVHPGAGWGQTQTRATAGDGLLWINWIWAWENPHSDKTISGVRFEPISGTLIVSALSAGEASCQPLRWQSRRKACFTLPEGDAFHPDLDEQGLLQQIQIDMGQVISATPRLLYPNDNWPESDNNEIPAKSENEVLLEYTAHPDACFHFADGSTAPLAEIANTPATGPVQLVPPATQVVKLRAVEQEGGRPVPVKLHIHGKWGEYLAPSDRHRIINPAWFEDYGVDFVHHDPEAPDRPHSCTYIPGETTVRLPLGKVYVEVSKGFEIRPIRRAFEVTPETDEITIEMEKVLPWRERGWVTADTHVHFLSPMSALLEGAAEGGF